MVQLKAKAAADQVRGHVHQRRPEQSDANAFDGIDRLSTTAQTVAMGTNGGTLTLEKLDEAIDKVKAGKPHLLLMSRRSRRKLTALSRASGGGLVVSDRNEFGQMVEYYDGIPVGVNDHIADDKTVGTLQRLLDDLCAAARRGRGCGADGAGRAWPWSAWAAWNRRMRRGFG